MAALDERADHISRSTLLFDDPRAINTLLDRTAAVSADQVGEAAARWLLPQSRATVSYTPGAPAADESADTSLGGPDVAATGGAR